MTDEPKKPKRWYMLVELTDETKRKLAEEAKRHDWSMRKLAKHVLAEYVQREIQP